MGSVYLRVIFFISSKPSLSSVDLKAVFNLSYTLMGCVYLSAILNLFYILSGGVYLRVIFNWSSIMGVKSALPIAF